MDKVDYYCPLSGEKLQYYESKYLKNKNKSYKIINTIPRFCPIENYSDSFGFQWNLFDKTQLDTYSGSDLTSERFWNETNWDPKSLTNMRVLEVGCGAGRFSEVFLKESKGVLYSIDYSTAVDANLRNNRQYGSRLKLSQASIYQMPFADNCFDKIFCLGVLQHTPSFQKSLEAIVSKLKVNGEVVIDFYPSKGLITKLHSKYILRPITKRIPKKLLLFIIKKSIRFSLLLFDFLCFLQLGFLTRFIPITDVRGFPVNLSKKERIQWAIMDTFDAFSPEFDNPQKLRDVINFFKNLNCEVSYAGLVEYEGGSSTVVRAIKK